jgi:hypothetical protein
MAFKWRVPFAKWEVSVYKNETHNRAASFICNSYVKVKWSLCFDRSPRHEGLFGEWRYSSTLSLTSALDGGEWSASRPASFTPRGRDAGNHWVGGWLGSRAVRDAVVEKKIPSPRRELNPRTPIVQSVAQSYNDWAITAPDKVRS